MNETIIIIILIIVYYGIAHHLNVISDKLQEIENRIKKL